MDYSNDVADAKPHLNVQIYVMCLLILPLIMSCCEQFGQDSTFAPQSLPTNYVNIDTYFLCVSRK